MTFGWNTKWNHTNIPTINSNGITFGYIWFVGSIMPRLFIDECHSYTHIFYIHNLLDLICLAWLGFCEFGSMTHAMSKLKFVCLFMNWQCHKSEIGHANMKKESSWSRTVKVAQAKKQQNEIEVKKTKKKWGRRERSRNNKIKRKIYFVYALILHSNTHRTAQSFRVLPMDEPLVRARVCSWGVGANL